MSHVNMKRQFLLMLCLFCITVIVHAKLPALTGLNQQFNPDNIPDGLSASDWDSIQAQVKAGKYKTYPGKDGNYYSSNPAHGWQIRYGVDGTTTLSPRKRDSTTYHLGLKLSAIGYDTLKTLQHPHKISRHENTLDYHWNATLTERWINNETDLEQRFFLTKRPAGATSGHPLTLTMTLNSALNAYQHGNNIRFINSSDTTKITYNKLKVWDVTGRQLPAHMHLADQQLSLIVDDSTAHYPLTIDPSFQQQAYLKASNTGGGDQFGGSVAISGNTVVIGAVGEDSNAIDINGNQSDNSASFSGAVYVFIRSGDTWVQQAYLKASNTEAGDQFGRSVAIAGETIVVGAPVEASNASGIDGDQNDNSAIESGAAYIFTRNNGVWSQQAYLKASNTETEDLFGDSVAIEENTVVVGAWREASNATEIDGDQNNNSAVSAGAAYVFTHNNNTWSQQAYLKASNTEADDSFGASVDIAGDTVVIGAWKEDSSATGIDGDQNDFSANNAGAAYVFTRSGNTWSQQAYLKASNTEADDSFGESVGIAGDTVVVGAFGKTSTATEINGNQSIIKAGAAYVFTRNNSTWSQQASLTASITGENYFGESVAIANNTVVVGSPGKNIREVVADDTIKLNNPSAYVFSRNGTIWIQQAILKAPNITNGFDDFGNPVSIADDFIVVGAAGEDNAKGVNSDQIDHSAFQSGAAYLFAIPTQQTIAIDGLWWIPSKPGSGCDIGINNNNDLYMIWYTYTLDGHPIWYLASAPLNDGNWKADLFEFTWDGNTAISNRVGDVQLSFQDPIHATLNWTLNTGNGSADIEYFMFEQGSNVSAGTWFDASQPGYGLTQVNQGTNQVKVLYFYDQAGNPTWALGSGSSTAAMTTMDTYTGTCPVCPFEDSVASAAGTVTTTFSGQRNGVLSTNINLLSPLLGSWQIIEAIVSNLSE